MRIGTRSLHTIRSIAVALGAGLLCAAAPVCAALSDEIQVYDDAINKPGEFGVELHVNTTPVGRSAPDYPGEVVPRHSWRVTPEFSYGLSKTLEAGFYLPLVRDDANNYYLAGVKARLKWLPQVAPDDGGLFYGMNLEVAHVGKKFEAARNGMELRPILGYRNRDWLLVTNPVLGYSFNKGFRAGGMDFSPAYKVARTVTTGIAAGFEYYADVGKLTKVLPVAAQTQMLFFALDVDRAPWVFNVGIGRGLNTNTDRWTLKAIFDLPF